MSANGRPAGKRAIVAGSGVATQGMAGALACLAGTAALAR